ncbi:MAG TPA: oligopeptide/dipeptide ABC transporter ATP-binding protein [Geobacterales bacterium]|nr:oligopeptide/dipeptide ABC transporter ATP-binding protein [Geobacterales bacterium]
MSQSLLEVIDLKKHFRQRRSLFSTLRGDEGVIPAVDGVSFYLKEKETVGLVGESGCGKTTVGKTILGLTGATSGKVLFDGHEITAMRGEKLRRLRSNMQMIFQDLDAGLNPKMRVKKILQEALNVHHRLSDAEVDRRIYELLDQVKLKSNKLSQFPHELSGGEKRRIGLARVLAVGPRFIVADEPTSALDVSIQAQVVNLLRDLQQELSLSFLFISHDLRIVELMSHKVAVMYLGKIVEMGVSERISHRPAHPYTRVLWASLVEKQNREAQQEYASGAWGVFDFERPVAGCRFAPRCPVYEAQGRPAICTDPESEPQLLELTGGHYCACHFPLS